MGGHGGLNILPQKRWNVYNFENREKVRRDEEAAAEEERLLAREQRQRDGESRRERLLVQARERRLLGLAGSQTEALDGTSPAEAAQHTAHDDTSAQAKPLESVPASIGTSLSASVQAGMWLQSEEQGTADAMTAEGLQHINLFEEEEKLLKASTRSSSVQQHRGSLRPADSAKSTGTIATDEDERWRLGYGASTPWYAAGRRELHGKAQAIGIPGAFAKQQEQRDEPEEKGSREESSESEHEGERGRRKQEKSKGKALDKKRHRSKHCKGGNKRQKHGSTDNGGIEKERKVVDMERLREERLEREAKERLRISKLLAQKGQGGVWGQGNGATAGLPSGGLPHKGRGYNTGYGYGR